MSMNTNLKGRIRNTSLPKSSGLLPMFEAVVNSIHSIEEADISTEKGRIDVEVIRSSQASFEFLDSNEFKDQSSGEKTIVAFKIIDNGIGFNEDNFESFKTLDTDYKAEYGGRGVGRLIWLKAFEQVAIKSSFKNKDGEIKRRNFHFNATYGVSGGENVDEAESSIIETCVELQGFKKRYRENTKKQLNSIARDLFEHCLWYFVRKEGAPQIKVKDSDDEIDLFDLYDEHMANDATNESIEVKGVDFDLTHIKLRTESSNKHSIAYCAAKRLVLEEGLRGKISALNGSLSDDKGDFFYKCYVVSPFLDENVRSERTGFDIEENATELFKETEISMQDIRKEVVNKVSDHLDEPLNEIRKQGRVRVQQFVEQKKPRYRSILNRVKDEELEVDPNISDKDLDLHLHSQLAKIEGELISEGQDIMQPVDNETIEEYKERLEEYLQKLEDVKKSDLANYVSHRKVIIDILENAIKVNSDGKYAREDIIHNLIIPMGYSSNELVFEKSNLWIIDERLAFHHYLSSDEPLRKNPTTGNNEGKRPDIYSLNVYDNPILVSDETSPPFGSISIIEIKRPMRNDASQEENDPITQALNYLDRVRRGKVKTHDGRTIPNSQDIPGFCYVICDITESVEERCRLHDAIKTRDGLGYFFYHKNYSAYVEVISFDRLVNSAKQRNRAFFDQLGLPTS